MAAGYGKTSGVFVMEAEEFAHLCGEIDWGDERDEFGGGVVSGSEIWRAVWGDPYQAEPNDNKAGCYRHGSDPSDAVGWPLSLEFGSVTERDFGWVTPGPLMRRWGHWSHNAEIVIRL
jgi:hypothetical protein